MFLKRGDNIFFRNSNNKMLKDVKDFFCITNVEDGDILASNGIINIYELKPCLVLEDDDQLENMFFASYIKSIKMFKVDYQIIVDTRKFKLQDTFNALDNAKYKMKSKKQKTIVGEYKNYLRELSNDVEIYNRHIYLVIKKLNESGKKELEEALGSLNEIGIETRQITSKRECLKILYECINKIWEV